MTRRTVFGAIAIPLFPELEKETLMQLAVDPKTPPTPKEAQAMLDKIATMLGYAPPLSDPSVLATDLAALIEAAKPPIAPTEDQIAATARRHGISAREVIMCAEMKVDVALYAKDKREEKARRAR